MGISQVSPQERHFIEITIATEDANKAVGIRVGDVVTVRISQEMGYNGILIMSGRESVMDTIAETRHVNELYR